MILKKHVSGEVCFHHWIATMLTLRKIPQEVRLSDNFCWHIPLTMFVLFLPKINFYWNTWPHGIIGYFLKTLAELNSCTKEEMPWSSNQFELLLPTVQISMVQYTLRAFLYCLTSLPSSALH
jgi:hypothetical protein